MKNLLRTALVATTLMSAGAAYAQTRLSLYEEFSGENCNPCAAYNPGLWSLISANPGKVMLIKYQSPIPSAGPIYNAYKTVTNARISYYNVPFAPYGVQNGNEVTGNIVSYTQASIDASVAAADSFSMSASYAYSTGADSMTASIIITTPNGYSTTGANLKLRVAFIEHLQYCAPPGTNGETEFHNVVREMYPDANGTSIANTWTTGASQTYTLKGRIPSYVDKSDTSSMVVVWIQNDATKHIEQAAKSTHVGLANEAGLIGCPSLPSLACVTGTGTTPGITMVTLANKGTTTVTSATIYFKLDNGTLSSTPWTGSLLPGTSASVTLPTINLGSGAHIIYDSLGAVNGSKDVNTVNNVQKTKLSVRDASPATLPVAADFESGVPPTWTLYDPTGTGANWVRTGLGGHNGSNYSLEYAFYENPTGDVAYAILPNTTLPSGPSALDFWIADAQYTTAYEDQLDVVYSTDCGATWNTIWTAKGADLATVAPSQTEYTPMTPDDWHLKSIDMSAVPSGAAIAFRATSAYGNNLYIDDVNLRAGTPTGIKSAVAAAGLSLVPNPAHDAAALHFSLPQAGRVAVNVMDALGRNVATIADANMAAGAQQLNILTAKMAAGVYSITIRTDTGLTALRLSVIH